MSCNESEGGSRTESLTTWLAERKKISENGNTSIRFLSAFYLILQQPFYFKMNATMVRKSCIVTGNWITYWKDLLFNVSRSLARSCQARPCESVLQMYVSDDVHGIKKLHVRSSISIFVLDFHISQCNWWFWPQPCRCWWRCIQLAIHRAYCTRVVNWKVDQDELKNKDTFQVPNGNLVHWRFLDGGLDASWTPEVRHPSGLRWIPDTIQEFGRHPDLIGAMLWWVPLEWSLGIICANDLFCLWSSAF